VFCNVKYCIQECDKRHLTQTKPLRQRVVHHDAIAELAEVTHRPAPVVARVFEEQFTRLKSQARITDYLVLFASRRTRELLSRGAA
jgi:hypothetical protein